MRIDPDVRGFAVRWGLDPHLLQAVVNAEGNIVKAVQCSIPSVTTQEEALEITCRSAAHAMSDYLKQTNPAGFISYWAARWAPVGAANDPASLNKHWPKNVLAFWKPQP